MREELKELRRINSDLLAACEAVTAALDAIKTNSDYLPGERNRNLQAAREQVRVAIAKAK